MTTRFLTLILFSLGHLVNAQNISSFSKVTFVYDRGHSSFGNDGQYSVTEVIEYTRSNSGLFQITKFIRLMKNFHADKNEFTVDSVAVKFRNETVVEELIEKFLSALNTTRDNFNAEFVRPKLKAPANAEILEVATRLDEKWKFDNDYSDRSERREIYRKLKHFDKLDTFLLKHKPHPEFELMHTDIWNSLSINFTGNSDTIEYRSQFLELFGQPVRKVKKNGDRSDGKTNLEINTTLRELLPTNALIREVVDLNQVKKQYIAWYLSNYM